MPKRKSQKIAIVNDLAKISKQASAMVFADFSGLKTRDLSELRKTAKSLGGNVTIMKKTLAQRGLAGAVSEEILARPGGIAAAWFSVDDIPAAFKSVWKFSKKNEALKILGGYASAFGGVMDAERVLMLAKLPSREALLGQMIWMLKYPLLSFAAVIDAIQRSNNKNRK